MKGYTNECIRVFAFAAMMLWSRAPVHAQDTDAGADTGTDTDTGTDAGAGTDTDRGALHPPHLLDSPPPMFPPGREGSGLHPTVILLVTVTADAKVADIVVEHSASADFDAAAVEAVERWTFEPATKDGEPIPSRIRVAVHFEQPEVGVHDQTGAYAGTAAATEVAPDTDVAPRADADEEAPQFRTNAEVDAERLRSAGRGAADFTIGEDILNAAPVFTANDLLKRVPGLYAAQPEGSAVGDRYFLRGFDSEHGQDIEFKVNGIRLNQPSHIHGQGYVYQGLLIPELIRELRVTEGVYDPEQGDFAIAGTIDYELAVDQRGVYAKTDLGSFRTFRQIAIFAPEESGSDTFGAFQLRRTDGFGENRGAIDGSAMFQYGFGRQKWRFRLLGGFGGVRSDLAGVLRLDDIQEGNVGWYDVYQFDTALEQNGFNMDALLGISGAHRGKDKQNSSFSLWLQFHDFRLKENFTGFLEEEPNGSRPGDLVEQRDRRVVIGGDARHRTQEFEPAKWARGTIELGLAGRADIIDQSLSLLEAPQDQVYENPIDANIAQTDVGMWLDLDWDFTKYLSIMGGVRTDVLFFNVTDYEQSASPDGVVPYRRTAVGVAVGPRVVATVKPIEQLDVVLSYGRGFRSPQARTIIEGEDVDFTWVHSADVGLRSRVGKNDELTLAVTGFLTKLSNDLIFEAHEARFETLGPTSRIGAVFYAQARPLPWLYGALSITYVKATLDETPEAEPDEPPTGLEAGDPIPFVPPWLIRLDIGASHDLVDLGKHPLHGHIGVGYTFLSDRPLRFSETSPRVNLLELNAGLSWWFLELGFQAFNVLNVEYAAQEFVFESNWDPTTPPPDQPARHISAGAPRTFLFVIGFRL